ncbi:tRNA pseudouridine(55) synthase TruB [soil metagenome]
MNETPEEIKPINPFDNSIFLVDKPYAITSFNAVSIFKKEFKLKKVGHAGTLDPNATGLLVLCSGNKTKIINEFIEYDKDYTGVIRIGAKTKTFDTESTEYDEVNTSHISDDEIKIVGEKFLGKTEQIPPMHSALKHKGKPLYKLARAGETIERKPREIIIEKLFLRRIDETKIYFEVSVSKGTYIRCLANDIGESLGVGGYLKELRRTRVGKFILEDFPDEIKGAKYKKIDV